MYYVRDINHESSVSLETAKMLKQAGFDWPCDYIYNCSGISCRTPKECKDWNNKGVYQEISHPSLAVAQRWLREEKEMFAEASLSESHHTAVFTANVYQWVNKPLGRELRDMCMCTGIGPVHFDTYEEALEESIKKCLEILLQP